jgi:hypothetical protein
MALNTDLLWKQDKGTCKYSYIPTKVPVPVDDTPEAKGKASYLAAYRSLVNIPSDVYGNPGWNLQVSAACGDVWLLRSVHVRGTPHVSRAEDNRMPPSCTLSAGTRALCCCNRVETGVEPVTE